MSAEMAIFGFRICFSFASMGQELMLANGLHFRMAGAVLTARTYFFDFNTVHVFECQLQ